MCPTVLHTVAPVAAKCRSKPASWPSCSDPAKEHQQQTNGTFPSQATLHGSHPYDPWQHSPISAPDFNPDPTVSYLLIPVSPLKTSPEWSFSHRQKNEHAGTPGPCVRHIT